MHYDGWVARFGGGYSRRANSVSLLTVSSIGLQEKISHCESLYRTAGQKPIFKIAPVHESQELDGLLNSRGYTKEGEAHVMTREIERDRIVGSRFVPSSELSEDWLDSAMELNAIDRSKREALRRILLGIQPQTCYAKLEIQNRTAALCLAVLERQWLGIYDVVTANHLRRQGIGQELINDTMAWGSAQDASKAYLQVMTSNQPALNMYHKLGFETQYTYWYRCQ